MSGWLLDTNVISEWRKPRPDRGVVDFLSAVPRASIYTSTVCFAEIRKGISQCPDLKLQQTLGLWLEQTLRPYFAGQLLEMNEDIVFEAMMLLDGLQRIRKSMSVADLWIVATAKVYRLTVVTRNAKDLVKAGIPVLTPWTDERFNGA